MGRRRRLLILVGLAATALGGLRVSRALPIGKGGLATAMLVVAAVLLYWCLVIKNRSFRRAGLPVASTLLVLVLAEFALGLFEHDGPRRHFEKGSRSDRLADVVGYGAMPGRTYRSWSEIDGVVVNEATYGIDGDGLRRSPPAPDAESTLLCFGGSFMFGEGLPDDRALPARVSTLSGGRVRSFNFAFHGYGPHQMTRLLESGRVAAIVEPAGRVTTLYWAIPDHLRRVSGHAPWDLAGPRYELDESGAAAWRGRFDDRYLPSKLKGLRLGRLLLAGLRNAGGRSVRLFGAVVDRARRSAADLYPGSAFHVLLYDSSDRSDEVRGMEAELTGLGIRVHSTCEALGVPRFSDLGPFVIPRDGHPDAETVERLSRYVLARIIE